MASKPTNSATTKSIRLRLGRNCHDWSYRASLSPRRLENCGRLKHNHHPSRPAPRAHQAAVEAREWKVGTAGPHQCLHVQLARVLALAPGPYAVALTPGAAGADAPAGVAGRDALRIEILFQPRSDRRSDLHQQVSKFSVFLCAAILGT
jgi:hypothetical protein